MITKGTKVFVTGGNGFVGSWLVSELVDRGCEVTCLIYEDIKGTQFDYGNLGSKVKEVRGDISDEELIAKTIKEGKFDVIFHLAAQALVGIANKEPVATFKTNIQGAWSLLEACRLHFTGRAIIVASSDKAYGTADILPYDEKTALRGIHPYDVSKSCEDLLSATYFHTYRLPIAIVRCGNIFGGGDTNRSRIVPEVCLAIKEDRSVRIRSNGKLVRDYVYVEDVVDAYITVAESLKNPELHGESWNVSNEKPMNVLEMVEEIVVASGAKRPLVEVKNEATNEIPEQYLSSKKIRERLGWKAKYSRLDGLKKTFQWYLSHDI